MSEEKIFKVWKRKKNKCKISGVRKKNEIERKVPGKKMVKILLSSCSLVGLYVNLQVKVTKKKKKIFRVFFGKLK